MHYALIFSLLKKQPKTLWFRFSWAWGKKKNQKKYIKFDCRCEARSCLNKDVTYYHPRNLFLFSMLPATYQLKGNVLAAQLYPALCDPMDCSFSGSSVHGIFQAGTLEWVAIPFSMGSSWLKDWTLISCIAGKFFTIWVIHLPRSC